MPQKPITIFMLLKTRPEWLQLSRKARNDIAEQAFAGAMSQDQSLAYRHYDAEAFSGSCTDIAVFETTDPRAYYFALERLRDTPVFAKPYFEVIDIIPAFENGYLDFEKDGMDHKTTAPEGRPHAV